MNENQLLTFCSYIVELKSKLKCIICLDIIKDLAELDCGHKFCSGCFEEYKSKHKNISCPCCKSVIKRRSLIYKDEYFNKLAVFVSNVCNILRRSHKCEVEELVHSLSGKDTLTKSKEKKSRDTIKNVENPSTSKVIREPLKHISKPSSEEDAFDVLLRKTEPKSNKIDKLLINKTGTTRIYNRKKQKKADSKYKILDFDDDQNKAAVLTWLTDTRNKFDRLTQTQINEDHDESIPIIDLTSVSQVEQRNCIPEPLIKVKHKNRAKSLDIEIKKTVKDKKRYSDGSVVDLTENYFIDETNVEEEKVIKKVEENILMNFIEDQYLDKLENELINEKELKPKNSTKEDCNSSGWDRVGKIAKTLKKKEKVPKMLNITIQSSQSSNLKKDKETGSSKNETKAVIERDNCFLKVHLQKMKDARFMLETKKQSEQTGLHSLQPNGYENKEPSETISDPSESDMGGNVENEKVTKTYDLQDFEKYIENNIDLIKPDESLDYKKEQDDKNNESTENNKIKVLEVVVVRVDPKNVTNTEIEDPFILPTQKWNASDEDDSYSTKRKIDDHDNAESKAITDSPLPIPKLNTLDELNCGENIEKNIYEQTSHNPFLMLTQENPQELCLETDDDAGIDTIIEDEHLINVSEIIEALQKDLVKCSWTGSSKLLDHMKSYLNRLKLLTTNAAKECVDNSTQTDFESYNKQTQTILDCSVKNTQTELETPSKPKAVEVHDVEVQYDSKHNQNNASQDIQGPEILNTSSFEQPVSTNVLESFLVEPEFPENGNSEEQRKNIDLSEIITQNTKDALQSFITDPEIIQSSPLSEPIPIKNILEGIIAETEVPKEFERSIRDPEITKPSTSKEPGAYVEKSTSAEQGVKNRIISDEKSQNQILTCSLDNFNFETQDLTKNILNKIESQKKANIQNEITLVENEKNNSQGKPSSVLMCTLDSNLSRRAKKKLIYPGEKFNKSKRSLSDSDSEEVILPKRLCNRFIRDDLTIEFDVNTENAESQRSRGSTNTGASDVDNADYEGYLDKFMKKYDSDGIITTPEKKGGKSVTYKDKLAENRTHNVSVAEIDCDAIVAKVNENVQKLAKHNDTSKSSYHTASQDSKKSSRESREYSEMSDIIGETESERMEPLRKKTKNENSAFRDVQFIEPIMCTPKKNQDNKRKPPCDDIVYDLEDSLDDADFVNIKIDIEEEPMKQEKNVEEDLFSDDDIVETTPQKRKSLMGKRSHQTPDHIMKELDIDFDAIPPPIDFQDEPAQIANENSDGEITIVEAETTVKELKQSLTPDGLSQFRRKVDDLDASKVKTALFGTQNATQKTVDQSQIWTRNLVHSTPLSQRGATRDTLGFSPITGDKSIIEQAQSSKNTLTSVTKLQTPKSNIMTSTPKQKSIWNYVRPQEPEKEPLRLKPCIASTRLSKDQMLLISSLTDRNLVTSSNVFNKNVTHMIVAVDDNNCLKDYTMKFVAAVAAGIWVLRFEWVQECLRSNSIVPEEPFEVLDDTGMPGPQASRLTRKESLIFEGFKFFCAGPFYTVVQRDVEEVIKMQGGKLLSSMDKLTEKDGRISLIITEAKSTPDSQVYENWLELYKTVTVDMEWLSRCVGRYKILNIRRYIWFSDDNLENLGYPDYLMESIDSSSEQYSMSEKY